ncbi:acid protease [Fomitiporia mediterranea MF3/22]|uniref:acid protease n=1 Tax=Fomitiporia mediterranea (strain MF3/22) TaxID=694068 RepID=UPI0004408B04|nr:acid protease [Fomitiporia mediterranea MF3/22]EJD01502.1 acid protease [Fomitiporia mediterranea MF3/22]
MKSNSLSILLICALSSAALRIPFRQSKTAVQRRSFGTPTKATVNAANDGDGDTDISTVDGLMLYMANMTVAGTEYLVQLDTGSSDLWVKDASFPMSNASQTSLQLNLTYGIGWAFGNITTAEVEFAGVTFPKQAFLDVSSANNPALSYGAEGVLGLGFTSLSNIDSKVNASGGDWGRSLLYNAFLDKPEEKNYITFALQRSTTNSNSNDDVEGAFTIGELDPKYTAIENSNALSTWPVVHPSRWTILLDTVLVGTNTVSVSSNVSGAPSGKAVVLLDSGTSYSYCPTDIAEAIYGGVNGAKYDPTQGMWTVPCDAEIDMALQFGGNVFPLHPLDVVVPSSPSSKDCIGSFIPQELAIGSGQFDWILGDNFLRSVYTMYDLGDFDSNGNMGNPYIKLLNLTDPNEASSEFVGVRGGTARTNITYNAADGGSSSGSTSISIAGTTADKLNKLVDYIPAVLAILALNALALLIISAVGLIFLCRRRRRRNSRKERGLHALDVRAPTPFPGSAAASGSGSSDGHKYERVSSHMPVGEQEPEDMPFTPPEPAFHSYEGDTLRPLPPGARPRSTFGGSGLPRDYRVSAAGSDVTAFVPPEPPFKMGDRPKSIA